MSSMNNKYSSSNNKALLVRREIFILVMINKILLKFRLMKVDSILLL